MSRKIWDAVVVGAGAAGVFASLRAKECTPELEILVLERSPKALRKVAISGGGRCNVTHSCASLDWLLSCYPRGGPHLEVIFGRFMPEDTVAWFAQEGVALKTEADGRMFPVTDSSATIIDCLLNCAENRGVALRTGVRVKSLTWDPSDEVFNLGVEGERILANKVLLATGGGSQATKWLKDLGHTVIPDIPSLFTFCSEHAVIEGLQGLAVPQTRLRLNFPDHPSLVETYEAEGPFLVTHWGVSGPAVLKLSAFAARTLAAVEYRCELLCDLIPSKSAKELRVFFKQQTSEQQLSTKSPFTSLPKRLWRRLLEEAKIDEKRRWAHLSPSEAERLIQTIKSLVLPIQGKGVFKEEFVTAGGVPLPEMDPYTMESRVVPGLYVAGELLDVDGITGGFNFQNAWATGYLAGEGLSS